MSMTCFVIGESVWRCLEKKNCINRQRRNNSIDQILCLISQNMHRNILFQNNMNVLYSCGTDRAVVFKRYLRFQMDVLKF